MTVMQYLVSFELIKGFTGITATPPESRQDIKQNLFCLPDAESDDESAGDSSVQPQITSVTVQQTAETSAR